MFRHRDFKFKDIILGCWTYEFWLFIFLLGDIAMVYVFIHFYYLFITYKLHIDDKVEIFNKGKMVLEVNFGLGVKDVNQNHFDVPGH